MHNAWKWFKRWRQISYRELYETMYGDDDGWNRGLVREYASLEQLNLSNASGFRTFKKAYYDLKKENHA